MSETLNEVYLSGLYNRGEGSMNTAQTEQSEEAVAPPQTAVFVDPQTVDTFTNWFQNNDTNFNQATGISFLRNNWQQFSTTGQDLIAALRAAVSAMINGGASNNRVKRTLEGMRDTVTNGQVNLNFPNELISACNILINNIQAGSAAQQAADTLATTGIPNATPDEVSQGPVVATAPMPPTIDWSRFLNFQNNNSNTLGRFITAQLCEQTSLEAVQGALRDLQNFFISNDRNSDVYTAITTRINEELQSGHWSAQIPIPLVISAVTASIGTFGTQPAQEATPPQAQEEAVGWTLPQEIPATPTTPGGGIPVTPQATPQATPQDTGTRRRTWHVSPEILLTNDITDQGPLVDGGAQLQRTLQSMEDNGHTIVQVLDLGTDSRYSQTSTIAKNLRIVSHT